jgi:hypothetical protein
MSILAMNKEDFFSKFNTIPHVFLSKPHLEIHLLKSEECIYLVDSSAGLGIFLRIAGPNAYSPYAAPFGGVFSRDNRTDFSKVNQFIRDLFIYLVDTGIKDFQLAMPASIYSGNTTTKLINSLINGNYSIKLTPEINSHIALIDHNKLNYPKNIKEIIRKTSRTGLTIKEVHDDKDKLSAYKIVEENRKSRLRTMSLSYKQLRDLDAVCETRYFIVNNQDAEFVSSAITFRSAPKISYTQFWGDSPVGRNLNAMDFLAVNLVDIFQAEGWSILDLGVSTESGIPNSSLLRFKESHLFTSSLKFTVNVRLV